MRYKEMDFQRQALYDFEWEYIKVTRTIKRPRMNMDRIYKMVDDIMADYNFGLPYVVTFYDHACAEAGWRMDYRENITIHLNFPLRHRNAVTVCHEIAHALCFEREGLREDHHGAWFCGIYFQLLSQYLGFDRNALYEKSKKFGVEAFSNALIRNLWPQALAA